MNERKNKRNERKIYAKVFMGLNFESVIQYWFLVSVEWQWLIQFKVPLWIFGNMLHCFESRSFIFINFIRLRILLKFKTFLRDWPWWLVTIIIIILMRIRSFFTSPLIVILKFKLTVQFKGNSNETRSMILVFIGIIH